MPLLDHFTVPVPLRQRWESFRMYWAAMIGSHLNDLLPNRFHTIIDKHRGVFEGLPSREDKPDLTALMQTDVRDVGKSNVSCFEVSFPAELEVAVVDLEDSEKRVGVIQFVIPSNKSTAVHRRLFAGKSANYLAKGIGPVIVNPVASVRVNLHDSLMDFLGFDETQYRGVSQDVAACELVDFGSSSRIDFWPHELRVGDALPTVPFAIKELHSVSLALEETYAEACRANNLLWK